jgi:thiol-disulfide isomerase/thioredoxin
LFSFTVYFPLFIVNPVDFGYSESYLNKPFSNFRLELDTVYNSKNLEKIEPPKMDLRKGKHIVGFLSSTCGHCKIAAQKLSVIHSENPSIPIYFFINGDNDKIKSFIAKTNTDKISYSKLNSQLFIELAGLKLPVIYYLNNSVVEKQVDYFTLEQGHIEQWLKK